MDRCQVRTFNIQSSGASCPLPPTTPTKRGSRRWFEALGAEVHQRTLTDADAAERTGGLDPESGPSD